jgi:hypothetical protein
MVELRKSELSVARRRLVNLMSRLRFGRLEGLDVRSGEPLFSPPPRVFRELKFESSSEPQTVRTSRDFAVKREVIELFKLLDRIGDGRVLILTIRGGLPFRAQVEERIEGVADE